MVNDTTCPDTILGLYYNLKLFFLETYPKSSAVLAPLIVNFGSPCEKTLIRQKK